MFKSIIEADVYRIKKELQEGAPLERRGKLIELLQKKEMQLNRVA